MQVGNIHLPAVGGLWELSNMADRNDLRGMALYDQLMQFRPDGLAETEWAEAAGVNRSFFSNLKAKSTSPRADTLRKVLRFVGRSEADLLPAGIKDGDREGERLKATPPRTVHSDQPRLKSVDSGETAPVTRLDLSYSMGPGADLDSSYVDGEAFEFDIGFLRSMTVTPPDRIRIVDGIGDSMQPTLHDRDLLFVDVNQRDLNAQDRIWAIWLFGLGAVKRLRAVGPDRVLVISDNPDVDNQEVSRTDILIHGRVIGSIKRH